MATPIRIGDGRLAVSIQVNIPSENKNATTTTATATSTNSIENDENVPVITTTTSPKMSQSSQLSPRSPEDKPPLSPSKQTMVSVERHPNLAVDTRDDPPSKANSLVYSATPGSQSQDDDFSIDRYAANGSSKEEGGGDSSLGTLSIERSDSDRLEEMMAKFDDAQTETFDNETNNTTTTTTEKKDPAMPETPKELDRMLKKFDLLQQDTMDSKLEVVVDTAASPPGGGQPPMNDGDLYRDNRQFEVLSPTSPNSVNDGEGFEVGPSRSYPSKTDSSTSYGSAEMFEDIEQFRSAESHSEHHHVAAAAAAAVGAATGATPVSTTLPVATPTGTQKIFEQRIVTLMNRVSKLELEKDELRSKNSDLQGQLRDQHDQDVNDMYTDMYQNPFAAVATPTKSKGPGNSFGGPGISTSTSFGAAGPVPSTVDAPGTSNSALHTELTELRMRNQTLQNDLETSDRVKERLKKVLRTVQDEDKQKLALLKKITAELEESKERESVLKNELDECRVRLAGFDMTQRKHAATTPASGSGSSATKTSKSPEEGGPSSPKRRSFFSSSSDHEQPSVDAGDVATALVVSQKQNEALEAFNKELELQNTSLQKRCAALKEQYGLNEPQEGDDKGKQLYSRYLEMKSSLSSLSVVLEEAKGDNAKLQGRVKELETESKKEADGSSNDDNKDSESVSSSSSIITPQQEKALKQLVEKLEVQILGYRDAELQHERVRLELESTVDRTEKEASVLRGQLATTEQPVANAAAAAAGLVSSHEDLEKCYEDLAVKIASTECNTELTALKSSMDATASESTRLLNELETLLSATRAELETQGTTTTNSSSGKNSAANLQEEKKEEAPASGQKLLDEISSLQKQTKQLKVELEQKATRLEKSEKRVATKHEQALQLTKANESLRDGMQKLKIHLSSISEQASKTDVALANTQRALDAERETTANLEVERKTLQTKIDVLQRSMADGSKDIDETTSESIELKASLAASQTEVSLAKERVQKLVDTKKELELKLASTRDDLQTQLYTERQKNSELFEDLVVAERDLNGTKLVVAAATLKLTQLEDSKVRDANKLKDVLKSAREMSKERIQLSESLKSSKEQLDSQKKDVEGLITIKTRLETRIKGNEQFLEDVRNQNAKLTAEGKESSKQFAELEKFLATTQEELTEEEKRVEALEQQVDAKAKRVTKLEKTKSDLEVNLDGIKHQLFTLNAKNKSLECQLRAEKDYNSSNDEIKLLGIESLKSLDDGNDKPGMTQKLESLLSRLKNTESENSKLKSDLANLREEQSPPVAVAAAKESSSSSAPTEKETTAASAPSEPAVAAATNAIESEQPQQPKEATTPDASNRPVGLVTHSILDTATLSSYASTESNSSSNVVRRWEAELLLDTANRELKDALKQNNNLAGKVDNLETSVEKSQESNAQTLKECETHAMVNKEMAQKIDALTKQVESLKKGKEGLMQRTASLARRDQLQKASLQTSNDEVANLMMTMGEFQNKFEVLAEQVERSEAEKIVQIKEYEDSEAKWNLEKVGLHEKVFRLQKEHDVIKAKYDELDSKHVQILMREQSNWQSERVELNSKIAKLEKKDSLRAESSEESASRANDNYYPLRQCPTDRSLMNQKVSELEQDIALLQVTMDDEKREKLIVNAELEVTKFKLSACEEDLEAAKDKLAICEEELKTSRSNMQAIVVRSATDHEHFQSQIRELEENLVSSKATLEKTVAEHESKLQENDLKSAKIAVKERDNVKAAEERESDLRLKHNACLQELKSCKKALESMALAKATDLEAALELQAQLQTKYDSCKKELDACREELTDRDKVMKHIAKKQVVEHLENDDVLRQNKLALARVTDELNEAHVREKELEDKLNFAKQELFKCEKKVESFETEIAEEQYGAGVYKDVIAKLNKSNEQLTAKNAKLKEQTETLKGSTLALQNQMTRLLTRQQKQGTTTARGVAGGDSDSSKSHDSKNDSNASEIEQENLVMKDLLEKSQHSVADAKTMQKKLSSQVEAATKRESKLTREVLNLKAQSAEMEKRLLDQEQELDEFENDFALARNDARKVVEELRSQLKQLEKRNKQLEAASGGLSNIEDLKAKFKQLVHKNKRLQKEINAFRGAAANGTGSTDPPQREPSSSRRCR